MSNKYGLIGFPLGHSFSEKYFTKKFDSEGIDASYNLYPLQNADQIMNLIIGEPELRGLNVTIPHKKEIIRFLDDLSPEAAEIGAVNTIKISGKDNKPFLKGFNTDAPAFESEIGIFTNYFRGNALILGNGGAALAAIYALKKLGWKVQNVVRKAMDGATNTVLFSELNSEIMKATDLIVNATPVGMFPESGQLPSIPIDSLTEKHWIFDMVYNPEITQLMAKASVRGARTCNGLGMLKRQAELAWQIWQKDFIW